MNNNTPVLFSFQIINLAFVTTLDPHQHILVEQPAQNTFKVIKNANKIKNLFDYFEKQSITPICYSTKRYKQCQLILRGINPNINWIYIIVDSNNYPNLKANHAKIDTIEENTHAIVYGQGFSSCEGKQELRIAICSAMGMGIEQSKAKFVFIEDNNLELKKLHESGYAHIFKQVPDANSFHQLINSNKLTESDSKQYLDFIGNTPSLNDSKFIQKIHKFNYLQNRKNITVSLGLTQSTSPPVYRLPNSLSICAVVFRYSGDKQIYTCKSEIDSKIGGDLYHESQQNKIVASIFYQMMIQNSMSNQNQLNIACLPMYLSHFSMRHALIKSYNKSKAWFVVRPFVHGIKSIAQQLPSQKRQQMALKLMKEGKMNGKIVKGLGRIIAISLICNQSFRLKGILQTVSVYGHKDNQNENTLNCCKIDIQQCFNAKQITKIPQPKLILLSSPKVQIDFAQIYSEYMGQIRQTLYMLCQFFPLFQSIFTHNVWVFNKLPLLQEFNSSLEIYCAQFLNGQLTNEQHNQIDKHKLKNLIKLQKINPKLLNYVVSSSPQQDFDYFTSIQNYEQKQSYGYMYGQKNIYEQKLNELQNFIIYGSCVPVLSLIKWIKSVKNIQIRYLSLLTSKTQIYTKHIKLAKTQKKNVLFILDHCEVQEAGKDLPEGNTIADSNWGLRTIFIYRLKLGSCKRLKILHDPLSLPMSHSSPILCQKLHNSSQQTFKTIFDNIKRDKNWESSIFKTYLRAILIYMQNKWLNIGVKVGIKRFQTLKDKLRMLVSAISHNKNRLVVIFKQKQFNDLQKQYYYELQQEQTCKRVYEQSEQVNLQHLKDVPNVQLALYCLPIYILNQKVWLMHDIYEYLSAYYLYADIMSDRWKGNFEGEQLQNFKLWYPHLSKSQKQKLKSKLMELLDRFSEEKQGSHFNQIMGSTDSFSDCMELMRKIGMDQMFSQLQKIYQVDGHVVDLIPMSNSEQHKNESMKIEGYLTVTNYGSIYNIYRSLQNNKESWNNREVYKAEGDKLESQYRYIGSCNGQSNKLISHYIQITSSNKQHIGCKPMMKVKHIEVKYDANMGDNQPVHCQKIVKLNLVKIQQQYKKKSRGQSIKFCDIHLINRQYLIFITNQLSIIICTIIQTTLNQQTQWDIGNATILQQNMPWSINTARINSVSKVQYGVDGATTDLRIGIGQNMGAIQNPIGIVDMKVGTSLNGQINVQIVRRAKLINKNKIKHLAITGANFETSRVEVLVFQDVTNALAIWQLPPVGQCKQQKHKEVTLLNKPIRRLYSVENQPVYVHKFGNQLFVGSKYKFIKKMIISPICSNSEPESIIKMEEQGQQNREGTQAQMYDKQNNHTQEQNATQINQNTA